MEARGNDSEATAATESSEIQQLEEKLREEHKMYLRALADFENYRRRVEAERTSAARREKREIILSLLELLDGFELALQYVGDAPSSWTEGVKTIYRKLVNLLERQGVVPIQSLGQAFDPKLHEAIDSVRSDDYSPGTVVDEVQRGYRWGDELLRSARVRVAF
jgi:molecular chaperone GrpE